jgi:hypothetical protein
LQKVEQSQVFVCDVSIVNDISDARPTPNPNVLIELGYALSALGEDRVLLVLNEAFGGPELLPFDLRMRRAIPYRMPEQSGDGALVRKALEQRLAAELRTIFVGLEVTTIETVGEPPSPFEQALEAVSAGRRDSSALTRRYMTWLAEQVLALTPRYSEVPQGEWDELLVAAIDKSQDLCSGFTRLAEAIASMKDLDAVKTLYSGFGGIVALYAPPRGAGRYYDTDFDFAKFIGHELLAILFSFLVRDDWWEILSDLLDEDIHVPVTMSGSQNYVSFGYVSQKVALLDSRNRRQGSNRISIHADILKQRHTETELAQLVPMEQFVEADYLLFLCAQSRREEPRRLKRWLAWSTLYMDEIPRFLQAASRVKYAERLLRPLGVGDIQTVRNRVADHKDDLHRLFPGIWFDRMWDFDPGTIGSRP